MQVFGKDIHVIDIMLMCRGRGEGLASPAARALQEQTELMVLREQQEQQVRKETKVYKVFKEFKET